MKCAACGASIDLSGGARIGLREACPACDADLHRCIQCRHYEPGAYNDCREPNAERVVDPERANRCDWYSPGQAGDGSIEEQRQVTLSELDSLFKKS